MRNGIYALAFVVLLISCSERNAAKAQHIESQLGWTRQSLMSVKDQLQSERTMSTGNPNAILVRDSIMLTKKLDSLKRELQQLRQTALF